MAGYADALAAALYPNSAANSMYTLGGQGLSQIQLPTFSNPWVNMFAQGAQQLAGGALQAYGVKSANEANLANAAAMVPQLSSMGVQVPSGVQDGLMSPDPKVRQIALALTENSMQASQAERAANLDFQKYAKQKVFDGITSADPRARQAALEAAGGIGLIKPEAVQNVGATKLTPYDRALEIMGDPDAARKLVQDEKKQLQDYQEELRKAGNARKFVTKQFEDSKSVSSLEAMIPKSKADSDFAGIETNLRTHLQKLLGREMNSGEQEKLKTALPVYTDSAEQIDRKRSRYLELIDQLVPVPKPPRLSTLGSSQASGSPQGGAKNIPIDLGGGANTGTEGEQPNAPALSPAQAREILKARGVAGY